MMQVRHSIIGISHLIEWAESIGMSRESLLRDTGFCETGLKDPHGTVLPEQELTFYRNLMENAPDNPMLAYQAGFQLNAGAYGMWGLALLSSPTFEEAIRTGIKYIDFTYTYNKIWFEKGQAHSGLYLQPQLQDDRLSDFMVQRDLGAVKRLLMELLEQENPITEVHLMGPEPDHHKELAAALAVPLRVGRSHNCVLIPNHYLQRALPQANQLTHQMCHEHLDAMRPGRTLMLSVTQKVFYCLSSHSTTNANLAFVADNLNMSQRSLRRKLMQEGKSFQAIVNEYKKVLAKNYLQEARLTIEDIAERLGYSDCSGFSNAYKRWYGVPPSKHQRK